MKQVILPEDQNEGKNHSLHLCRKSVDSIQRIIKQNTEYGTLDLFHALYWTDLYGFQKLYTKHKLEVQYHEMEPEICVFKAAVGISPPS